MRKLHLELDDLAVESFPTADGGAEEKGTVEAHAAFTTPGNFTCRPHYTCPECAQPDYTDRTCYPELCNDTTG